MPAQAGQKARNLRASLTPNVQALGARQAAEFLGYSVPRFYALAQRQDFPLPVQIDAGYDKKWIRDELMAWLSTRPRVIPRQNGARR